MKKIILAVLLSIITTSAMAQYHGYRGGYGYRGPVIVNNYHGYHGGCYGCGIGAGIVAGAIIGSSLTTHYYNPVPVYVNPTPVYVQPSVPYGYHYETMLDPNCNCYRNVLVAN
jgi:hypothetical protein